MVKRTTGRAGAGCAGHRKIGSDSRRRCASGMNLSIVLLPATTRRLIYCKTLYFQQRFRQATGAVRASGWLRCCHCKNRGDTCHGSPYTPQASDPSNPHQRYLADQGYQSSHTHAAD